MWNYLWDPEESKESPKIHCSNTPFEMVKMPNPLRLHGPQVEYVGKLIKQAKRRVTWKFCFEGDTDDHSVSLLLRG